jgi:hypothetical protein
MPEYQSAEKFIDFIGCSSAFYPDVIFQEQDRPQEGILELGGGFIEFSDIVNLESISVANPSPNKCSNDSKTASNKCYFIGTKVQFWTALGLGFVGGVLIATVLIHVIFYLKSHT